MYSIGHVSYLDACLLANKSGSGGRGDDDTGNPLCALEGPIHNYYVCTDDFSVVLSALTTRYLQDRPPPLGDGGPG